jgi:hypothetical protein
MWIIDGLRRNDLLSQWSNGCEGMIIVAAHNTRQL